MTDPTAGIAIGRLTVADFADTTLVTGARCRLDLPYDRPPESLWGNTRAHWRRRSAETRQLRNDVLMVARSVGLHRLCDGRVEHVTAGLVWAPGDRRPRDEDNLAPMQKVACDGLARGRQKTFIGLDLVPDDSSEHFTKLAPRILPPPEPKGMWLDILLRFRKDTT